MELDRAIKREDYKRNRESSEWQVKQLAYRDRTKPQKKDYDKKYAIDNSSKKVENAQEWAKSNPERRRAISHNYDARRRVQVKDGVSSQDLAAWVIDQSKVCYWCGVDCEKYHIDHYKPLSKGGTHDIDNMVISCPTCNLKKNAKDPYDFAQEVGRLF